MIQSKIFHVIVIFFTVAIVEKAQEAFSKKYIPDYYITMSRTVNNKFESTQSATANTLRDSFST